MDLVLAKRISLCGPLRRWHVGSLHGLIDSMEYVIDAVRSLSMTSKAKRVAVGWVVGHNGSHGTFYGHKRQSSALLNPHDPWDK